MILAMGAGYVGKDYASFGIPTSHLPTRMEEGVEVIPRAWTCPLLGEPPAR
jgi:alkanesulfonate monooxygenase SsuD/methylene tetrahydromethanopterin reductase-like flavin-dependent oxidoreductase (luciferase family)